MVLANGKLNEENSSKPRTTYESVIPNPDPTLAAEILAAGSTMDLSRDPDDPRRTRVSKVTINGVLHPFGEGDIDRLESLFMAFNSYYHDPSARPPILSGRMRQTIENTVERTAEKGYTVQEYTYLSIDPGDYTIFEYHRLTLPVIKIHTRPEAAWFLGQMGFDSAALGMNMGRLRVMKRTEAGVYPVLLRTKYRSLTDKVKQQEAVDAYRRLIDPTG